MTSSSHDAIGRASASAPEMKDFEVLGTVDGMRTIADPIRLQMIHLLTRNPSTGSVLARAPNIPANRAHYRLQRLLAGLYEKKPPRSLDRATKEEGPETSTARGEEKIR